MVLLVDVSGSMAPYADALLRLAHVLGPCGTRGTEVFTVGHPADEGHPGAARRDPEVALRAAGEQVPDWSGGTRLGEVLRRSSTGGGSAARPAVRSSSCSRTAGSAATPGLLADQMARLRRLAHRVVWVNPHRGKAGTGRCRAGSSPRCRYVDDFVAGHSLATFAELVEVVARA